MTKHEKVSLRLSALAAVMELTGGEVAWEYACQYIRDALDLLDEYTPRILTLGEVKEIGEAEEGNIRSEDTVVVWVEALDGIKHDIEVLEPARLTYSYHPEWGRHGIRQLCERRRIRIRLRQPALCQGL